MKIFFSTLFDTPTYPANIFMTDGVAIGDLHMGPLALLQFLELHLGLSNSCSGKLERIFNYRKNLLKHTSGAFYKTSLESNDLEVAIKLLSWRDELKEAGWDFKTKSSSPKRLRDLARVEQEEIGAGYPERFNNVISELKGKSNIPINEVIVHEPLDVLPTYIAKLFTLLIAAGVKVYHRPIQMEKTLPSDLENLRAFVFDSESSNDKIDATGDGTIQLLKFGDMLTAGRGLAALMSEQPSFKPVIINELGDNSLSLSLQECGLPSTGQAMQSISHPDLQLLAIIPVWLWKPYHPQQVLDFFLSPLNIFDAGLSTKWMSSFSENPGICLEDWLEEINNHVFSSEADTRKAKQKERLEYVLNLAVDRDQKISTINIIACYQFFYTVLNKRCTITTNEQLKTRLQRLCNAFLQFISLLNLAPEKEMDSYDLQKLLQLVLQPVSTIPFEKQRGSLSEIEGPGVLAGSCDDLLWFGFTAAKDKGTLWNEWTTEELKWLNEKGVYPDTAELTGKRNFWNLTQWLRFVKRRLILVVPSTINGEPAEPHPFQAFLKARFRNLQTLTLNVEQPSNMRLLDVSNKLTVKATVNPIPQSPDYWNVKPGLFQKRDEESFSSLENLMKYPYRWVLAYKAKLYRGNTLCLPDRFTFYGTLSHKIFQQLLLMPDILKVSEKEINKRYKSTAQKFIDEKGLLLHAVGEEANLKIFSEQLCDKLLSLIKHIKENNWEVEDCEIKGSGKIGDETVMGYCDLLLKRGKSKNIEKAIVDLKYAGKTKYRKLMEDGEDLQLAIYSKIFHPQAKFCPTSYFIILEGLLFTTCKEAFKNGIILRFGDTHSQTYADALTKIENTVKFRRKELSEGRIEVGENVSIEDLEIFHQDPAYFILPPKASKVKSLSSYNNYETLIDTE